MVSITAGIILWCILYGSLNKGTKAKSIPGSKQSFSPSSLSNCQLKTVSALSDGAAYTFFNNTILEPFLRVRVSDTEGNRQVQKHIENQMSSLGWHVTNDSFQDTTPYGVKNFNNIIAQLDPNAESFLTLTCHFDSKFFAVGNFIGATDSAVPCAMLIGIAHQLNKALKKTVREHSKRSLQFIFFDGEEAFVQWSDTDSTYGSRHLAAKMANEYTVVDQQKNITQLQQIELFILLDLIGSKDTVFINWFSATTNPQYQVLQKIEMDLAKNGQLMFNGKKSTALNSNTYFTSMSYPNGGIGDDHLHFLARNVPIVHAISYPFPSVWHTLADNAAALDQPTINNIMKIFRVFVVEYLNLSIN